YPNDVDPLPSGRPSTSRRGELVEPSGQRLLITDRDNQRIVEIDHDGNIVWQLGVTGEAGDDATHLNLPHNADRLPNGDTILADSGNDRIIQVDAKGTIVWEYRPTGADRLRFPKDADRLPNNNVLITDSHNSRVVEVTSDGTVVWEYQLDLARPYDADRLANGNTLISGTADGHVIEVDPAGTIVWQYPPPTTPTLTAYEPPIDVTFNIHLDPVMNSYTKWRERKDNLLWLKSFVEGYSGDYQPKLNIEAQGDHAEFYLNPTDPEAAEGREALADLYDAGHSFGTHAHDTLRSEQPDSWTHIQGTATAAEAVENWQDHIGYVEQLYAEITGNSDPEFLREMNASAVMFLPKGSTETQLAFTGVYSDPVSGGAVPHGFSVQTGGRNEHFYCIFDHDVQNPWRPGTQGALDEDLTNTAFVTVPQMPPLGKIGVHAHIPDCIQDNSVPSRQRMFIQEFLERLYREYTDAPDRVWTFGWHEHLFDIYPTGAGGLGRQEFREEVEQMVEWLNERFIGQTTANGNLVAHYATVIDVRDEFEAWEQDNPGVSSFELEQYTDDWDNYPYDLEGLARELANAHYAAALLPPDSSLQIYRFERCPSSLRSEAQGYWADEGDGTFGCYDSPPEGSQAAGNPLDTATVYVAWRDAANPEPTDLTEYAGDWATAYDGVTGSFLAADDALNALPLDFHPVVILPSATQPAPAGYLMLPYNANYMWGSPTDVQQATAGQFVPALNRHMDLMERLGVRADYYFTGLASEKLDEWSHETVTRLLESSHDVHYHGANRPPYPQLVNQVSGEDWEQDVATARTYEAEGINPGTGVHVGGITAFREVFGQDPFATGRFFEASILAVDKEMGARMAVGLVDNTGASRDQAWFLGVLNRPTQAGLGPSRLVEAALQDQGEDFLARVRDVLTGVSGPMPLVAFPIHDHDFFDHSPADQDKVWELYEEVIRMALDLGFQVVTMRDVYGMVQNGPAPAVSEEDLLAAAQSLVETMEATGYPPEFVPGSGGAEVQGSREKVEKGKREKGSSSTFSLSPVFPFSLIPFSTSVAPLSLAEAFEGFAVALAAYDGTGSLPATVETNDLLGPTAYFTSSVTPATVPADAVLDAAVAVSAAITDRIPSQVTVGSQALNPAEVLYLMAQEYVALVQGGPAPVTLRPMSTLPLAVTQNQEADPLTKLQFWTYKPAVF
ncbi:MAG: PQQ-binding-like beta-propeller repeat protein, partial [Anaerolineae bacterium]